MRLLHAGNGHDRHRHVNRKGPELDEPTIRHELEGNICRCTGYHNIVKSVAQAAREMGASPAQAAE